MKRPAPLLATMLVAIVLAGCASSVQKVNGWLSSNADALATVDGRVLFGKLNFPSEREANLQMETKTGPVLACSGKLRFGATKAGLIAINCSDGRTGTLSFAAINTLSGTARGSIGSSLMNLTYGLSPDKASGYLGLPPDKLIEPKAASPALSSPGSSG